MYLINRLPSLVIDWKTPHEMLFKKPPVYSHLKVFGCLCFNATLKRSRNKMDERARKSIFIGFPANTKGYILYDLQDHSIFISRDVYFYESNFPFKSDVIAEDGVTHNDCPISLPNLVFSQQEYSRPQGHSNLSPTQKQKPVVQLEVCSPQNDTSRPEVVPESQQNHRGIELEIPITINQDQTAGGESNPTEVVIPLRRSLRTRHKPQALNDYHCAVSGVKPNITSPY